MPRLRLCLLGKKNFVEDGATTNDDNMRQTNEEPNEEKSRLVTHLRPAASSDGVMVLDVSGEIDLATLPAFKQALLNALDQSENGRVILNMTGVGYMDSSGFGTLLSANKGLRASGGTLSLVGCNPNITRMIFITRLNTLFSLYDTENDALAAVTPVVADAASEMPAPAAP